jgi:membrane protein DedA with SNARE-associated domain
MWLPLSLAAATLVSEDATTLSAALLVRTDSLDASEAIAAVALGIWIGDLGLFAIGRLASRIGIINRWMSRRWTADEIATAATRFQRGVLLAILASRFLPGSRVPLYVAAGAARVRAAVFVIATALAAVDWTTAVVLAVTGF